MIPVGHLNYSKIFGISAGLVAIFGCEVFDISWLAVNLAVQICHFLTRRPKGYNRLIRIVYGLWIRNGEPVEDVSYMLNGTNPRSINL